MLLKCQPQQELPSEEGKVRVGGLQCLLRTHQTPWPSRQWGGGVVKSSPEATMAVYNMLHMLQQVS